MVNPLFMTNASVTIDAVEQADAVSNVTFTPTTSAIVFKGISGEATQSSGSEAWAVSLTYAQDYSAADSLAMTLFNRAGETVEMVFTPTSGSGTTVTATVTLVAGAIGGAVDTTAEATAVLPINGRPTIAVVPAV